MVFVEGKGEGEFMNKIEVIPSLLIILMGSIDCVTTILGVVYSGAKEVNPVMAGIVSTNVGAFLAVKIGATIFIAATYIFARKILMGMPNRDGKAFTYSIKALTFAYAGLICFLTLTVANNLLILIK